MQGVGQMAMQFLLADHENGLALNLVQHGMVQSDPEKGQSCEDKLVDMHYFRSRLKFTKCEAARAHISVNDVRAPARQFFDDHGFMPFANAGPTRDPSRADKSLHDSFLETYLGADEADDARILRAWIAEINARAKSDSAYHGIGDQRIKTALGRLSVGILWHWKNEVFDADLLQNLESGSAFFAPTQGAYREVDTHNKVRGNLLSHLDFNPHMYEIEDDGRVNYARCIFGVGGGETGDDGLERWAVERAGMLANSPAIAHKVHSRKLDEMLNSKARTQQSDEARFDKYVRGGLVRPPLLHDFREDEVGNIRDAVAEEVRLFNEHYVIRNIKNIWVAFNDEVVTAFQLAMCSKSSVKSIESDPSVQAAYRTLLQSGASLQERNSFIERHSHTLAYSYAGGNPAYRSRSKAYGQAAGLKYDGKQYWMAPHEVGFGEGVIMESVACVHATVGERSPASLGTTKGADRRAPIATDEAAGESSTLREDASEALEQGREGKGRRLSYDCRVVLLEEK